MIKKTDIRIDRLAIDGDGIGRLPEGSTYAGQVAFVPYTLPLESVSIEPIQIKKNHSRWLPIRINQSSSERIQPACSLHFKFPSGHSWCGGCNWQHMNVNFQRKSKSELVSEALVKIGQIKSPPVKPTLHAEAEWRYRNKVQVPFGNRQGKLVAGFFAPQSHEIVDFDDCLVQPKISVDIVRFVKDYANKNYWKAYEEDRHEGWVRHLLIRTNEKNEALVVLVTKDIKFPDKTNFTTSLRKAFPSVIGIHQNVQTARTNVILGQQWIKIWGETKLDEEIAGLRVSYSVGSFFQVNTKAAERLYQEAIAQLNPEKESIVLELYCGVGVLSLLSARKCQRVIGVENVGSAIEDARENAQKNKINHVEFIAEDAGEFLLRPETKEYFTPYKNHWLVLLDPPRTGCEKIVIDQLLVLEPKRIVYISCHPATLARDLKMLTQKYTLQSVVPVDLFPQTSHIESISTLNLKV
jgi:23S rRNA (uracil1939-C5)-methyltransferase